MIAFKVKNPRRHLDAMGGSARIGRYYYDLVRRGDAMVAPKKVIRALNDAGVSFVLMGAYGLSGWRKETRSTKDVDVLVVKRDWAKAVRAISEAFPHLEVHDTTVVTRFLHPKSKISLIDVMKPVQKVFQMVFRHTIPVGDTHRIPNLEMAIVSKFAAMVSPYRDQEKKMLDGADFLNIVKWNLEDIDAVKLVRLAEQTYRGGGREIRILLEDVRAGREIRF